MYNLRDEATHGKKELQIFKNNKRERLCFIYDVGNGARKYDTANGERSLKNLRKKITMEEIINTPQGVVIT